MSRYAPEHKEKTHAKIVATAAKLFRRKGYSRAGVQKVMRAAGLTQGGFYAHFDSKDHLLSEALADAFGKCRSDWLSGLEGKSVEEQLAVLIGRYISKGHRDNIAGGCPSTALTMEVARSGKKVRGAFEEEYRKSLKMIEERMSASDGLTPQEKAMAILSLGAGAVSLARAVSDPKLSDRIVESARRIALHIGSL